MTDYFRGKTLICEQTKPKMYFTPIFQRIGDSLKLHHMEVDCLSYQHSKKMLPVEHMGKHKRRIFELEDENAKLRELLEAILQCAGETKRDKGCDACPMYNGPWRNDGTWCLLRPTLSELGIEVPS